MSNTALVTGASSGIGRAAALAFAEAGAQLCLVGRDTERLKETVGACRNEGASRLSSVGVDLAEPGAAARRRRQKREVLGRVSNADLCVVLQMRRLDTTGAKRIEQPGGRADAPDDDRPPEETVQARS